MFEPSEGPKRVLLVMGTRPEAIKIAPIIRRLAGEPGLEARVCVTAQHRSMLDEVLRVFRIVPDFDLDIMRPGQTLSGLSAAILEKFDPVLERFAPDWVLVQGDTTTSMIAALAAFYRRIRVGHVEAGLRTGDLDRPWPEEANRRMTAIVATRHYCPTEAARRNLLREGVAESSILVTGNTVIDALESVVAHHDGDAALQAQMAERFAWLEPERRLILVTGHRRESFGEGFRQICDAIARLAERADVQIVYPVHLNPNVRGPVFERLSHLSAVRLVEPLDYLTFVWLMQRAFIILTDSGGVQEEAPSLGKPVLVMREKTERPEGVEAGTSRLVGTSAGDIVAGCSELLDHPALYQRIAAIANPYGDGRAAERIVRDLLTA